MRSVAPGAPFVTRQKISPRRPTAPAGPGPTIAQLNEIQRLRDATGVICDRPTSREKADRQIAALGAYLEDDVRDAPEHFRPAARPKAEIGVPADVAAEIDQIIARWQAPTLTTGSVLNRLRVTPLPQPSVVRAHLRALVQSRKLRKVGKNRFVRLPDLNAWD